MVTLPRNTENISVSLPSWLLAEIDEYCEKNDFTWSKFSAMAARKHLWQRIESIDAWEQRYANKQNDPCRVME
jgi:metal-responsive CopG/Arc/MetJ family transcriptional regulator